MKGTAEGGRVIIFIPDFWRRNVMCKSCYHLLMDRDVSVVMCSLTSKFVIFLTFDWQVQQVMLNLTSRYLYTCKLPYCNEVIRYFDLIDRFNKLWNLTSHNNLFISKLWYFDGQVFWVVWQVQQVIDLIFRYSEMLIILLTGTDHVELGQSRSISYLDWRVQLCKTCPMIVFKWCKKGVQMCIYTDVWNSVYYCNM